MEKTESNDKTLSNDVYRKEYTKDFVQHWDDLIGWEGRGEGEKGFFHRILRAYEVKHVADVASGTGYHAVNLAREEFEVTATDGAENMIRQTQENARDHGVELADARVVDWLALAKSFGSNRFDALVCLGNAFTHLFEHEARRDALENMYEVLKPGGIIIMDHRNYDAILEQGYSSKHRFYYTGHGVEAKPVRISRTLCRFEYKFPDGEVFHLSMYPLKQDYMTHLLEDAGFLDVTRYGDFVRPYEHYEPDFIQQVGFKPHAS